MLRRSYAIFAKRTPGYVFWRQSSLVELEKSKRSYLMSERPVPIAEISRRMVRVKTRYEATQDYHDRNLLRGEYKYFSGKLCDLRAARESDMIAFLQCSAFFGFWDTAQVERVMRELTMRLSNLSANEMVCLFAALPTLRKEKSHLFRMLGEELVDKVPEMTLEESVQVLRAVTTEEDVPAALLHNLMVNIEEELESLSASQLADVLDALGAAPDKVRQALFSLQEKLQTAAVARCGEMESMDLAVLYTALQGLGVCDGTSEKVLIEAFTSHQATACARSVAMVFSAVGASHGTGFVLSQAMEKRVVYLATDFTVAELLAVLSVYVDGLLSMHAVAAAATPSFNRASSSGIDADEVEVALQRRASYQHVVSQLSDQLTDVITSASSFISFPQQLEALELLASSVSEACALVPAPMTPAEHEGRPEAPGRDATRAGVDLLLQLVPEVRRMGQELANKVISNVRAAGLSQLLRILQLANELGGILVGDAMVAAVVRELVVRDLALAPAHALTLSRELSQLTNLRAEHQRRIHTALIPKLRAAV